MNYQNAAKANVKIAVANKVIVTRLNKAVSLVQRLKDKDEKVQQFKCEANAERQKSIALEQALAREVKK